MGVGKTTYGQKLSGIFDMEFIDTDKFIEAQEGMDIPSIFHEKGEVYFREKEKNIVTSISERSNLIIATGGGIIKDAENMDLLKKNGIVVYLKASPEKIFNNLKGDSSRPLLFGEDKLSIIKRLLSERSEMYDRHCDITFDVSVGDVEHIVKCLVDSLGGVL